MTRALLLLLGGCCLNCCSRICGSLGLYDLGKERRISLRTPSRLEEFDKVHHKVTTTEDPVIREVSSGLGRWVGALSCQLLACLEHYLRNVDGDAVGCHITFTYLISA